MFKKFIDKFQNQVKKDSEIIKQHKINQKQKLNKPKVVSFAPKDRDEIEKIAQSILSGVICHVNFNKFSENEKTKYLYFILGVASASKSDVTKVDKDAFIFTPNEK